MKKVYSVSLRIFVLLACISFHNQSVSLPIFANPGLGCCCTKTKKKSNVEPKKIKIIKTKIDTQKINQESAQAHKLQKLILLLNRKSKSQKK